MVLVRTQLYQNVSNSLSNGSQRSNNLYVNLIGFGSMTDINRTLLRSLSSQNLNSTKLFTEPQSAAPRLGVNCNTTLASRNTNNEKLHSLPKLNFEQLSHHNTLKEDIEVRLNSLDSDFNKDHSRLLWDISRKYKIAFDRLNSFFIEIQQIQSKSLESENDILKELDQSLLSVMLELSEVRKILLIQNHWV